MKKTFHYFGCCEVDNENCGDRVLNCGYCEICLMMSCNNNHCNALLMLNMDYLIWYSILEEYFWVLEIAIFDLGGVKRRNSSVEFDVDWF